MKKLFILFLICSALYAYINYGIPYLPRPPKKINLSALFNINQKRDVVTAEGRFANSDDFYRWAFEKKIHDRVSSGSGKIIQLLPDDFGRTKRQICLVRLTSGQILQIKHDINDGKRIALEIGDYIEFNGTYNWDKAGGVVNKTHSDNRKNATNGWIKHNGIIYK